MDVSNLIEVIAIYAIPVLFAITPWFLNLFGQGFSDGVVVMRMLVVRL